MSLLLSPMLWRAVAVAAVLAGLAWAYHLWASHQRETGRQEVRAEWHADRLNVAEQNRLLLMARDKASGRLQAQADKQRGIDNAENHALDLRVDELRRRLRDRPDRPADTGRNDLPTVAVAGAVGPGNGGCTGAGLFRSDSEFLARQFANASRLQTALRSCRAQRQADIETVNGTQ